MFSERIVHPYERSWEKKNNHACEEQGYANLQSPNSKSPKLGCNAEDEPMLKREAEFSSHTIALLPAFREPHSARTWLGRCGGHTHAPLPSPPPSRAAELAARRAPFPSLGSSDVPVSRKATFALKKKRTISGLLIGLNFAHQMFPLSIRASALIIR